ncbi:MAG: hypothetical protein H6Q72_2987 [Firmicutes bacterium]|nr:hypothetical protein [Bacillota bacterium]
MQPEKLSQRYIWINPVVEAMAGSLYPAIQQQITARGYTLVLCSSGLETVRQEYLQCLQANVGRLTIDTRCPLVRSMIERDYPALKPYQAQVLPILMVCAQDLYEKYVKPSQSHADLTMVTPCSSLVELGNDKLGNVARFLTWIDFCREQKISFGLPRATSSPIPPGYFRFPEYRILEASGPDAVKRLLDKTTIHTGDADLLELLYCDNGCHNGDGV